MKKLFYTAICLFLLAVLVSSCGSREKCPGVGDTTAVLPANHV